MARSQMPDKKLRKVRQEQAAEQASLPQFAPRKRKLHSRGTLQAVYGDQQKVWRIVYVANGLWQLQQFNPPANSEGLGDGGKRYAERKVIKGYENHIGSFWTNHQRPTDYETAHSQLKRRDYQIQTSA